MAQKRKKRTTKRKTKQKEKELVIPENARIYYEVWFGGKFYGYTDENHRAGIISKLFSADGDLEKAKKLDKHKDYFPHLLTRKPRESKKNPLHFRKIL